MKFPYFLLALSLATTTHAAMLHDNGVPLLNDAQRSDADNGNQIGGQFTVTTPEILQGVQWWGSYQFSNVPTVDLFTAQIFAVVGGTPSSMPLLQYSLTGVTRQLIPEMIADYFSVYVYTAPLPNAALPPGNYVFSIMNDTTTTTSTSWFWANGTVAEGDSWRRSPISAWSSVDGGLPPSPLPSVAFNLTGTQAVPEPSSALLLGTIAAGLALRRNRAARR